jgi:hypothetical protein
VEKDSAIFDGGLDLAAGGEVSGERYSNIQGFNTVRITGNRVPYAPEQLLNVNFGYSHPAGLTALVEAVHTGGQLSDDLNTIIPTANGQRGSIPGNTIWNTTINYEIEAIRSTFFVTVKNLFGSDGDRGSDAWSSARARRVWLQVGVRVRAQELKIVWSRSLSRCGSRDWPSLWRRPARRTAAWSGISFRSSVSIVQSVMSVGFASRSPIRERKIWMCGEAEC